MGHPFYACHEEMYSTLKHREMPVTIEHVTSNPIAVTFYVPQFFNSSILGFCVFMVVTRRLDD